MELKEETITFFIFILVGIGIGIIFDFFRAIRKVKKYRDKYIYFQDIIFFILIGILICTVLIYYLQDEIRVYLFVAIFIGIAVYVSTISSLVIKIFENIIQISNSIFDFILLPLFFQKDIFLTIFDFFNKKSKKYCNKFYNMISYFYKLIKLKKHKIK